MRSGVDTPEPKDGVLGVGGASECVDWVGDGEGEVMNVEVFGKSSAGFVEVGPREDADPSVV
jgi:hypothetical protein